MSLNRHVLFFRYHGQDVQFIFGEGSVGLPLLIPKYVYSTFMTCYGHAVIPCLIIPSFLANV